jgi:metal-sulfur cluster biosynthetic enzyme/rhodanese-related sulfurtransferase
MGFVLATLAVVALAVVCVRLWRRVDELERRLGEVRRLERSVEDVRGTLERGLAVTRAHLADVAAGRPVSTAAIERGDPVRDLEAAPALMLWEQNPDLFVLDVRTPAEFASGHIPRAHLVPLDELEDRLNELPSRDTPLLVTCAAGGRSASACAILADHGFTRLVNLAGGMHAWTGPRERSADAPPPAPPPANTGTKVEYRGGPVAADQVIAAIRQCFDPEIPLNVYDLGLIYDVDIDESAIAIKMTLTSEGCPSARQIPEDVKQKVAALGQPNVQVDVVFDPPWHPARISAEGKEKLGLS